LFVLLALQAGWLAAARLVTKVGWGFGPRELPHAMVAPGWMTNLTDSLGYSTFLQQARWGEFGTSLLYTTTPHPAAYFNPLLFGLGKLAALTDTRPEAWLILVGVLAALLGTTALYLLGHLMGGRTVALASAFIGVFGSGWTWIQRLAGKVLGWDHYHGADLRFMDLLPSSAGIFQPLHTVGLAFMAWILWLLLTLETNPPDRASGRREAMLAFLSLLLGWIRPYEPAVLLAIYGLYVAAGWVAREPVTRRRLRWLAILVASVFPGLAYASWLAIQPVWNILSTVSLTLAHERYFWLQGFGGLWVAGAVGAWLWRRSVGPARLAVIWYVTAAVLLLGLNISHTKLLSGCGLALALVSGRAIAGVWDTLKPHGRPMRTVLATAGALLFFAGPGSLIFAIRESCLDTPRIEAGLWHIAGRIRADYPAGIPTVLTENVSGGMLPGIIGARIFAGHWVLTDDGENKQARLRAAGLEPDSPRGNPAATLAALRSLLRDSRADYLLLRQEVPAAEVIAQLPTLRPLAAQDGWLLFACPGSAH
jgi:hypothetical protein